jgi:hypothetical protein
MDILYRASKISVCVAILVIIGPIYHNDSVFTLSWGRKSNCAARIFRFPVFFRFFR